MRDVRETITGAVREMLNAMNAGVYVTDRQRTILFWNRRAEEITGYKAEDVVGTACFDGILEHIDKEERRLCGTELCPLHRSMVTDEPSPAPVLVYAKSAAGGRIPVATATAPIHDDKGNVIGGIEVLQDERENLAEMQLARASQLQLLEPKLPADERISFAVHCIPVAMIGGDYFDVKRLSTDVFSLFVADVAGHGVPAALFVSLLHYVVQECAEHRSEPAAFLTAINERLCERVPDAGFVTAVAVSFNAAARSAVYCSAGHPPSLLQKGSAGSVRALEGRNFPMGLNAPASYEAVGFSMEPGDRFIAYTDGVTDVRVEGGDLLGTEGLASLLQELPSEDGDHRLGALYDALIRRCTSHMPEDDITLGSCIMT
ncbi:MAG: SpoIIE family protein phosphatase [Planctomycetota bacterium]|jgi:PAS domain S-box-containing protein